MRSANQAERPLSEEYAFFTQQGPYENRDIFNSLDIAWDLLRIFQPELLKKIPAKIKDLYYDREAHARNTK